MLGSKAGRRIEKYVEDYVVFDLESTGVNTLTDMVIEIGAVKVKKGKIVDEFSMLVNPEISIPQTVCELTGISNEDALTAKVIDFALEKFNDFIEELPLVGHNIKRFDMKMLYRDATRCFGQTFSNDYIDTLSFSRHLLPSLQRHSLSALCEYYGIPVEGAHRALNDSRMNYYLFEKLKDEPPSGKETKICPLCDEIMYKRSGKHGKIFYSCSTYPKCQYMVTCKS